jgi:hypothetical protein
MIRVPAIPIKWPRALARNDSHIQTVVIERAEREIAVRRSVAQAERRKDEVLASAALDGRLFI